MAKYSEAQKKATQKYIKANYDEIKFRVPKGKRELYKAHAERQGQSLTQLIVALLDESLKGDKIMLRKNWRDFLISSKDLEEYEEAGILGNLFIVFEEDPEGKKNYDLSMGVFSDVSVAIEYAQAIINKENLYVANYENYYNGNYDYISVFEV